MSKSIDIGRRNLHLIHVCTPDGVEWQVWPESLSGPCGADHATGAACKLARHLADPTTVSGRAPEWVRAVVADLIERGVDLREVVVRVVKAVKATRRVPNGHLPVEDFPVRAYAAPRPALAAV